ncbi:MAG: hypothetical protein Q7T03_10315 [Deltaproteobacteria bacterium]|nr:hypothetical protein [Deltaproteobacteria bacterium]
MGCAIAVAAVISSGCEGRPWTGSESDTDVNPEGVNPENNISGTVDTSDVYAAGDRVIHAGAGRDGYVVSGGGVVYVGAEGDFYDAGNSVADASMPGFDAGDGVIDAGDGVVADAGDGVIDAGDGDVDAGDRFVDAGVRYDGGSGAVDAGVVDADAGTVLTCNDLQILLDESSCVTDPQTASIFSSELPRSIKVIGFTYGDSDVVGCPSRSVMLHAANQSLFITLMADRGSIPRLQTDPDATLSPFAEDFINTINGEHTLIPADGFVEGAIGVWCDPNPDNQSFIFDSAIDSLNLIYNVPGYSCNYQVSSPW